jgi:hypothetical protein
LTLLLSISDTDLMVTRAARHVKPYRYGDPAALRVDDLPALVEGGVA